MIVDKSGGLATNTDTHSSSLKNNCRYFGMIFTMIKMFINLYIDNWNYYIQNTVAKV